MKAELLKNNQALGVNFNQSLLHSFYNNPSYLYLNHFSLLSNSSIGSFNYNQMSSIGFNQLSYPVNNLVNMSHTNHIPSNINKVPHSYHKDFRHLPLSYTKTQNKFTKTNLQDDESPQESDEYKSINLIYFNARSIVNKLDLLQALIKSNEYDFIFISETWLRNFHKDSYVADSQCYSIFRVDRTHRGGGVAVIFKNELACKLSILESGCCSCGDFEILTFEFYITDNNLIRFTCVYLPPDSARNDETVSKLIDVLHKLLSKYDIYIVGDFNLSKINWIDSRSSSMNKSSHKFMSFLNNNNLTQLVTTPTHNKGGILDLLITSNPTNVQNINIREPLSATSDHRMMEISLRTSYRVKKEKQSQYNFYAADYEKINSFLKYFNWDEVFQDSDDIDTVYYRFLKVLHKAIELYVPVSKKRRKPYVPKHLKNLLNRKKKVFAGVKANLYTKEQYKLIEKKYKKAVHQNNIKHEQKVAASNNKNYLYKYMNKKTKNSNIIPPLKVEGRKTLIRSSDKANVLNSTFKKVFINDDGNLPTLSSHNKDIVPMPWTVISPSDVKKSIRNLKNSVSRTPESR